MRVLAQRVGVSTMRTAFLLGLCCLALFALAEQDLPGHLQPLGSHQAPEPPIREVQGFPSPLEFYDEHVVKSAPVLMKGAAKGAQEHTARVLFLYASLPQSCPSMRPGPMST